MYSARTAVKKRVLERDGYICWLCGKKILDRPTVDHVIPINRGGTNRQSNLRAAHKLCNNRRGDADMVFDRAYREREIVPNIKTYPERWVRNRLREAVLALNEMQSHFEALGHDHALAEQCGYCYKPIHREVYDGRANIFEGVGNGNSNSECTSPNNSGSHIADPKPQASARG